MRRILLVHDEREHLGGAETLLRELTAALRQQELEVAWAHDRVPQAVADFQPDFVCCLTVIVKVGLGALEWLQWQKVPHCLVLVDYWPQCTQRNLVHLSRGDICQTCGGDCPSGAPSPHVREIVNRSPVVALNPYQVEINQRFGIRTDTWLPCGLDTTFWQPDLGRPAVPVRVMASTAWSQQTYGNIWWKGEQYLRLLERDLGITVHGITGVPRTAVRDALRAGHIYVFPSVWDESWGYCLLEAMACGLACVAFDQAGARHLLAGSAGVLVERGNYEALRDAVAELLADPDRQVQLGRRAAAKVRAFWGLGSIGQIWRRYFEQVREAA